MKKTIIIICFLIPVSYYLSANNGQIEAFFDKYSLDETFTYVSLNTNLFSLFSDVESEDEDTKEMMQMLGNLQSIKILASEKVKNADKYYQEIKQIIRKDKYEDLAIIRNSNENIQFMVKEKNDKINELIVLVNGDSKFFFLNLVGEIDLANLPGMSKINVSGMKYLKELKKEHE